MAHEPVFDAAGCKVSDQLDRLVCMLTDYWVFSPEHGEIRLSRFLLSVVRELSAVPDEVIFLVRCQLAAEGRIYKPTLPELKKLCIAGMRVRPYLRDRMGMDVDHAENRR
jgi:hypothetical protein